MSSIHPGFPIACACASGLLLWLSLHLRRRQRLLADLPTSKTQGVFVGLVELKGTAESEAPLRSFLAGASCVHYAYHVQEHWSRTVVDTQIVNGRPQTRTRRESGWKTVAEGGEGQNFYVRDDTGVVLVRPAGAKLESLVVFDETASRGDPLYYEKGPPQSVANSDHRRRFIEHALPLHTPLYIVGQAREREDIVAPEIAASPDASLFLITPRTEEKVQTGHAVGSWFAWTGGLLVSVGAGVGFIEPGMETVPWQLAAALGIYLCVWALGWTWMVFNSLVHLRQRVRQAWSLIDVELKRRHDLIGPLTTIVSALGPHERDVQSTVASLRTQLVATKPGVAGPNPEGVAAEVRLVAEKYPALVSQPGFAKLHDALTETEQRIALARSYYNDVATYLATRLEQIPDRWVGGLARMQREPLLEASSFERAAVPVQLAER